MTRFGRAAALLAATLAGSVILSAPPASAATTPTPAGPVLTSDVGIDAIIGPDDRTRVSPTTSFPASAIVLLTFNGGQCTGFMISARAVATSGDCVYSRLGRAWRTNVMAYPGYDGTVAPFGGCPASMLFSPTAPGSSHGGGSPYDIGVVQLGCNIGDRTGWFGLAPVSGPPSTCTYNVGYPADKAGTQWGSRGAVYDASQYRFYHTHDTAVGNEGGPIILGDNDWCGTPYPGWPFPPTVIAIHSFDPTRPTLNSATPIDGYVFNYLMSLR